MLHRIYSHIAVLLIAGICMSAAEPAVWLDVPFVKQTKNACGAASIAMLMQFWEHQQGLPASSDSDLARIQLALFSSKAHGIFASDLAHYLQQHGYQSFAFKGRKQDLEQHLAKGRPLIAALKPAGGDSLHYVVVVGFDDDQKVVLLNDPAERKLLKRDFDTFDREWKGTGFWTLLAVPQSEEASSIR